MLVVEAVDNWVEISNVRKRVYSMGRGAVMGCFLKEGVNVKFESQLEEDVYLGPVVAWSDGPDTR